MQAMQVTPLPAPEHRAQRRQVDQENTQHNLQPLFLLQEQKDSHSGMIVTSSLTTQRAAKGKGIFQVTEPMNDKFSFQKALEPSSSDSRLRAFATIPHCDSSPR